VFCTGTVTVANDGIGVAVTPTIGGRPPEELLTALGVGRPEASDVPITAGLPLLLRLPVLASFGDEEGTPRDAEAAVFRKNPGCTKPSNASTTTDPAPATTARLALTALPPLTAMLPRWVPRLPPSRRPAGAPACDRPGSASVRKSSMTCSFSSAPARIGSSSGAHRLMQASRRSRQA
jgi:hypothetical protein